MRAVKGVGAPMAVGFGSFSLGLDASMPIMLMGLIRVHNVPQALADTL